MEIVGGAVSTTSGAASVVAGAGSVVAGVALCATGILAPVGITFIVGGSYVVCLELELLLVVILLYVVQGKRRNLTTMLVCWVVGFDFVAIVILQ